MPEVVATTFESFETLVAWLNSMGVDTSSLPSTITTSQELIAYIEAQGWQPVYTVGQYLSGFVKVTGADPSNTTDIVSRVVTDLVPVAGGAAGSLTSGKRTFGMISKRIAAGAIIAALGVCTFASQIGEYINNLVEGLTPFTLDGENMAVLLDQNGNAYLDARAIQKFRSDLAELGIFEKGFIPDTSVIALQNDFSPLKLSYSMALQVVKKHYQDLYANGLFNYEWNYNEVLNAIDNLIAFCDGDYHPVYNTNETLVGYAKIDTNAYVTGGGLSAIHFSKNDTYTLYSYETLDGISDIATTRTSPYIMSYFGRLTYSSGNSMHTK